MSRRRGLLGGFLGRLLDEPEQLAMHAVISGGDLALGEDGVATAAIADEAAGFADQDDARGKIPRRQVALPVGVEPAGCDPGEVEGRRAVAAQSGKVLLRGGNFAARQHEVAAPVMRQAAGDNGFGKIAARGDAKALIVEERALAVLGDEELLVGRIVNEAGNDGAVALERDRDSEVRNAVQEIGGAVERIDDPAMASVGAGAGAAFLAEKAVP